MIGTFGFGDDGRRLYTAGRGPDKRRATSSPGIILFFGKFHKTSIQNLTLSALRFLSKKNYR